MNEYSCKNLIDSLLADPDENITQTHRQHDNLSYHHPLGHAYKEVRSSYLFICWYFVGILLDKIYQIMLNAWFVMTQFH